MIYTQLLLTEQCTLNDGRRQLHEDRKKINKSNQDLIQHLVLPAACRCFGAKNIKKFWLFITLTPNPKNTASVRTDVCTFVKQVCLCNRCECAVCGEAFSTLEGVPCCTLSSMKMQPKYDKDQNSCDPPINLSADSHRAIKQIHQGVTVCPGWQAITYYCAQSISWYSLDRS